MIGEFTYNQCKSVQLCQLWQLSNSKPQNGGSNQISFVGPIHFYITLLC